MNPSENIHTQTFCPKCHRMYCEGYWGEGVCTADMRFSRDPTSRGDEIADYVRQWYELHRETWWDRHWPYGVNRKRGSAFADEFMLSFIQEIARVQAAADVSSSAKES